MTASWDRQTDETDEWYDRFRLYLYMGPERTLASAHSFVARLAAHGQLRSWQRAAQRHNWQARAADFDAELCRKVLASNEHLRMVAELLPQVFGALRHADLPTLSKEEARQLLPTFRLFFRDLLQFYQREAAQFGTASEGTSRGGVGKAGSELSADELAKFLVEMEGWKTLLAEMALVTDAPANEASWRPLRDVLAQLYADEASARRITAQARLDRARIHFSARAVDSWHAILTEAMHAGQLEQVIGVVQEEYKTNQELAKAVRHYRQSGMQDKKARAKRKTKGNE